MKVIDFVGSELTQKPWGEEYLVCRTESAALWCLSLNKNTSTSFHCHPLKRTGYVVLNGNVNIEFMSSNRNLSTGEFINFRQGLFHKTTALSERALILEIESPDNKADLLRLEDSSGRKSSTLEIPVEQLNQNKKLPFFAAFNELLNCGSKVQIFEITLSLVKFSSFKDVKDKSVGNNFLMLLHGTFFTNNTYPLSKPQRLLGSGDVISVVNLIRMKHVIDFSNACIYAILFEVP